MEPQQSAGEVEAPTTQQVQARTLRVLVIAQVLSGAGLAAGITVGALLAQQMLDTTSLAGLPIALLTAGSAAAALSLGRISQSWGRRPGLAAGYGAGALGSAGVVLAAVLDSPALLFPSLFVYGAGTAANLQARYAGADLAESDRRATAISTVLVATTLGGVAGPNLASATGNLADAIGIPHLAGPFVLAGLAYAAAALVLTIWLRPDPLLRAREMAVLEPDPIAADLTTGLSVTGTKVVRAQRGVVVGASVMVLTQLVMVAIMTMTPIHMQDNGHGTSATGLVIGLHVAAMFLPSPLTGRLVDTVGRTAMAVAAAVTMLLAGVVAAVAPADSVALLSVALVLLGLGWNFGLVAGTAIVTDSTSLDTRARTQGAVDMAIALAGAGGGLGSGFVVDQAGFPVLALAGGALSLVILPVMLARISPSPAAS